MTHGGDHPRLCGEKSLISIMSLPRTGSPPPMRGKVASIESYKLVDGITPAYAGKRRQRMGFRQRTGDHPRLCGEKDRDRTHDSFCLGSPPPMRGKVHKKEATYLYIRITPAYAGKSFIAPWGWAGDWDHPRLCGEKSSYLPSMTFSKGSPPPMRGKGV